MAHVALVDGEGWVRAVHVIDNADLPNSGEFSEEVELAVQALQHSLGLSVDGMRWLLTSYNGRFRGIFAGIGRRYDEQSDEFIVMNSRED